jgi:hypothetical protein
MASQLPDPAGRSDAAHQIASHYRDDLGNLEKAEALARLAIQAEEEA